MKICPERHCYDGDRFAECPYCGRKTSEILGGGTILTGFEKLFPDHAILPCALMRTKPVPGVSFAIYPDRLAEQDSLLFFVESDVAGGESLSEADAWPAGWAGQLWQTIEGYSSGVRVEGLRGRVILFRLDETKIKNLGIFPDCMTGGDPDKQPDYVFTWPGSGEFQCTLGEVREDKLVPLYRNRFFLGRKEPT